MDLRKLSPIDPLAFFSVGFGVKSVKGKMGKEHLVPELVDLYQGAPFAELYLGWTKEGLYLECDVHKPFQGSFFPEIEKGDGLEIYLDTHGLHDLSYVHKYCHHFLFYPKEVDEVSGIEVTRFKTEEKHETADQKSFRVETEFTKKGYSMKIEIPRISLFGYDPEECPRLSFAYIVHSGREKQEFPLPESHWRWKNHPNLWAEINLE